jgi:hypothetical protein
MKARLFVLGLLGLLIAGGFAAIAFRSGAPVRKVNFPGGSGVEFDPPYSTPLPSSRSFNRNSPNRPSPQIPTESQSKFEVSWGPLRDYFLIEDIQVQRLQSYSSSSGYANFLTFIVQAKDKIQPSSFYVKFYDLQGIESGFDSIRFNPYYFSWEPGQRSRGSIELPLNISRVEITQ